VNGHAEQVRGTELFDWTIDADNALGYGIVQRETNSAAVP
jgi:hypothetical protein